MTEVTLFRHQKPIRDQRGLDYCLRAIFSDAEFIRLAKMQVQRADPDFSQVNSLSVLCSVLQSMLDAPEQLEIQNAPRARDELTQFIDQSKLSLDLFDARSKNNPDAVFWPMPTRKPVSRFDMWPLAKVNPILSKQTPIGSAGSCFAIEVAKVLQKEGFNYVTTEHVNDIEGVRMGGQEESDESSFFSANYGLLFNTPSFRQLAEKAFGVKQFEKLLFEIKDSKLYADPYREDICFRSPEAYLADYDRHREAVRQAFLQSEVFIITLGLNECWQFNDGTFLSRNPRFNFLEFANHRTLSVAENIENIQVFYDIIKAHNPNFKLIVTVSPIPLIATGRATDQHVIAANTHSKSVLRVVAEEIVANNKDAYYFPSYEMVTQCIKDPWQEDDRHVTDATIAKVVQLFKYQFLEGCDVSEIGIRGYFG